MNKQILFVLITLSIVSAAAPEKKEFTVGSFFEGSWIITSRKVNLESGDIIGESSLVQYNITKTDENEYDMYPLESGSYFRDRNANQIVLFTPSALEGEVKKYNVDLDEFEAVGKFSFVSTLPGESYVRCVCLES